MKWTEKYKQKEQTGILSDHWTLYTNSEIIFENCELFLCAQHATLHSRLCTFFSSCPPTHHWLALFPPWQRPPRLWFNLLEYTLEMKTRNFETIFNASFSFVCILDLFYFFHQCRLHVGKSKLSWVWNKLEMFMTTLWLVWEKKRYILNVLKTSLYLVDSHKKRGEPPESCKTLWDSLVNAICKLFAVR